MMMYVSLILGFVLLIKGADYFVEASSSIARKLRIPSIIIGLTIVAFGTSAPELAVSTTAALSGNNDIAIGNVIGSNIFNLLVVLGACGVIHPFRVRLRWDYAASIGAGVLLLVIMITNLNISRLEGVILFAFFIFFVGFTIRDAIVNRAPKEIETVSMPSWLSAVYIILGLSAIIWGGNLVVNNASAIAASFGLSQSLIGLTIVAFGTSLPELVTSIVASRKGENGLALGNVIGSNLFNILMVLGISASISPIKVNPLSIYDAAFLILISLVTFLFCKTKKKLNRLESIFMIVVYMIYMFYIVIR
ncbi:calcium/sodium antiporter [Clostridium sp. E02]|uniref:calcium/sodium antiporter n=1 Tax=Clostridium sp. E02 TaxID=2487134 RepID=UPI00325BC678